MTVQIVAPANAEIEILVERTVELPAPDGDRVKIAVRAAGVNPTDYKSLERTWPRSRDAPIGYEVAGVVTAVGADVGGRVEVGDAVVAFPVFGGYASEMVVAAADVLPKPSTLDFAQAANLLLVGTAAAEMLSFTQVGEDETILLHGASGATGVSVLQQAAQIGARVVATASERNFDLVSSFGALPVAYGPGLEERVRTAAPDGINAAFDCVGTEEAFQVSLALVSDRGRIVTIVDANRARELGITFLDGLAPGSLALRRAERTRLLELAERGQLTVVMARTLPLTASGAREALGTLRAGHPGGKLALKP